MDTMPPFASARAATLASTAQQFAMAPPVSGRMATAATEKIKDVKGKLKREPWQVDAYNHAVEIGELGYFLTLISNTVGKGRLVVNEVDEEGTPVEPEKDADGRPLFSEGRKKAERVLDAFRGPQGDHRSHLVAGTLHDQIAGEANLIGEPIPNANGKVTADSGIAWEMVSVLELVQDQNSDKVMRKRSASSGGPLSIADPKAKEATLHPEAYKSRYHRSDWAHSGDATSALRRNASACREERLWTQLIHTTIRSRLSAALLLVPEEVDFPADEDGNPDIEGVARFVEMLVAHMSAPMADLNSAASLVPLVAGIPAEFIEKFRLMSLTDETLDLSTMLEARAVALRRVAAGMDGPLEIMEGVGGTSHWNASGIDTDFVKKHIIPLGERLARFFTVSYLRRMLIAAEEMSEEEAERFSFGYDGAEILTRMDAAQSADSLWRDMLISDDERREAHGFDAEATKPSDEEKQRRMLEKLALAVSVNNRPLLRDLIDFTESEIPDDELEAFLAPVGMQPEVETEPTAEDPDETELPPPAAGPDAPAVGEPTPSDELATMERIRTAASFSLDDALRLAANAVVTRKAKLSEQTKAAISKPSHRSGLWKHEVLRMLTPADWAAIDRDPNGLFDGAWDGFKQQTVGWLRDMYERAGRDPAQSHDDAVLAATQICHELDELAQSALRQPIPREDGLAVPLALVLNSVVAVR